MGARAAGLTPVLAVEKDTDAANAYQNAFPLARVINNDIRDVDLEKLHVSNLDVLLAGPPCQSFSTSNQKTRTDDNPLNNYLFEVPKFAGVLRPKYVIVENVQGLSIGTRRRFLDRLLEELVLYGYYVSVKSISGPQVGLPQLRNRLFIIGTLKYHGEFDLPNILLQPTVRDAISDLPDLFNGADEDIKHYRTEPQSKYAQELRGDLIKCSGHIVTKNAGHILERYEFIKPGGNWKDIPPEMLDSYKDYRRCHTGIYHRLDWDGPAKVIGNFRKNMLIHPQQQRGLSIREAARLQSFPDSYEFSGSIGKRQQQVGNAVPPMMAAAVLRQVVRI